MEITNFEHAVETKNEKIRYVFLRYFQQQDKCIVTTRYGNFIDCTDFPYRDIYSPKALTDFFKEYVLKEKNEPVISARHILITIGHGAGLAYFPDLDPEKNKDLDRFLEKDNLHKEYLRKLPILKRKLKERIIIIANLFSSSNNFPLPEFTSLFFTPEMNENRELKSQFAEVIRLTTAKVITACEFATTLKNTFTINSSSAPPIDMYININCYMQMFETGFVFKDVINYFVGSEHEVPLSGIDYKDLFTRLSDQPSLPLDTIAEYVIKKFEEKIKREGETKTSLSINQISLYNAVNDNINEFLLHIRKYLCNKFTIDKTLIGDIIYMRSNKLDDLQHNDDIGFIDFITILKLLESKYSTATAPAANNLLRIIKKTIDQSSAAAKYLYNSLDLDQTSRATAFSIFFPIYTYAIDRNSRDISEFEKFIIRLVDNYINDSKNNDDFKKASYWNNFIKTYIEYGNQNQHC